MKMSKAMLKAKSNKKTNNWKGDEFKNHAQFGSISKIEYVTRTNKIKYSKEQQKKKQILKQRKTK